MVPPQGGTRGGQKSSPLIPLAMARFRGRRRRASCAKRRVLRSSLVNDSIPCGGFPAPPISNQGQSHAPSSLPRSSYCFHPPMVPPQGGTQGGRKSSPLTPLAMAGFRGRGWRVLRASGSLTFLIGEGRVSTGGLGPTQIANYRQLLAAMPAPSSPSSSSHCRGTPLAALGVLREGAAPRSVPERSGGIAPRSPPFSPSASLRGATRGGPQGGEKGRPQIRSSRGLGEGDPGRASASWSRRSSAMSARWESAVGGDRRQRTIGAAARSHPRW